MRVLMICLVFGLADPAHALSCMPSDAVRLFEQVRDAEEGFYIVKGEISFLEPINTPDANTKTSTQTRARAIGTALTSSGFSAPFDGEVTVKATCVSAWCGDPASLKDVRIMALEVGEDGLTLHVGPCGGDQLLWQAEQENRLLRCLLTGDCQKTEF